MTKFEEGRDFYWEDDKFVLTAYYLESRGKCCGNGCKHCPYEPKHTKGIDIIPTQQEKTP